MGGYVDAIDIAVAVGYSIFVEMLLGIIFLGGEEVAP